MDRRRREAGCFRHRAQAPVRRIRRRRLERLANDLGGLVIADLARRAGQWLAAERPAIRCSANRRRHFPTVLGAAPSRRLMSLFTTPAAACKNQRAPAAPAPARSCAATQGSQVRAARCRSNRSNRRLAHRHPLAPTRARELYIFVDQDTLMFAVSSSRRENALLACERFRMAATEQGRRHDHQNDG